MIGWAGYDAKVQHLPLEHCLALEFRTALWEASGGGVCVFWRITGHSRTKTSFGRFDQHS